MIQNNEPFEHFINSLLIKVDFRKYEMEALKCNYWVQINCADLLRHVIFHQKITYLLAC